jgi:quercetin dioxygenase-like cupin family protein
MKQAILAAGAAILAVTSIPAQAHGSAEHQETTTRVFDRELPNVPGKSLIAAEVLYPPGGATPSHTHPASAFISAYVLSGEVVSAVGGEKPRVYRAGESWHEAPGAHHRVSRNARKTKPAKLLAIFVVGRGERQLKFPDTK